jgi:hypothetical protein
MKTSIVAALLAVGLLLRPQPTPITDNGAATNGPVSIVAAQPATPQILNTAEMQTAIGAGLTGCFQQVAANGDVYGTCCIDLWIFAVCVSVNWSAIERAIPFL